MDSKKQELLLREKIFLQSILNKISNPKENELEKIKESEGTKVFKIKDSDIYIELRNYLAQHQTLSIFTSKNGDINEPDDYRITYNYNTDNNGLINKLNEIQYNLRKISNAKVLLIPDAVNNLFEYHENRNNGLLESEFNFSIFNNCNLTNQGVCVIDTNGSSNIPDDCLTIGDVILKNLNTDDNEKDPALTKVKTSCFKSLEKIFTGLGKESVYSSTKTVDEIFEQQQQELIKAKQEADAAKQEADAAKQEANVAKQEADAAKQEANAAKQKLSEYQAGIIQLKAYLLGKFPFGKGKISSAFTDFFK